MTDGSRWYFPVFEGLFDAKHVKGMGPAIWLYGWILSRAWAAQKNGRMMYSHQDACDDLGVCNKTVRLWFERLQQHGYITTRARQPHNLDIEVSNWRSVAEWLDARAEERTYHSPPVIGNVIGNVSGNSLQPSISIKLLSYEYPTGADAHVCTIAYAFAGLLEALKTTKNKPAMLVAIHGLCFGGEAPNFGRVGKLARDIGGAGRLAEIMWQLSTKPPTGDVLSYIQKAYVYKGKGREALRGNEWDRPLTPEEERLNAIALSGQSGEDNHDSNALARDS